MKAVQGHGAKELLRVGGKLPGPGASLRFNVPQSTLMECRDGETSLARRIRLRCRFPPINAGTLPVYTPVVTSRFCPLAGLRNNKPLFAIRKSFKVENVGELPLTVMSMNINGYKCQGFGFEVLQCSPFSLNHNTSAEITVA